jgi:hypothetical protein
MGTFDLSSSDPKFTLSCDMGKTALRESEKKCQLLFFWPINLIFHKKLFRTKGSLERKKSIVQSQP